MSLFNQKEEFVAKIRLENNDYSLTQIADALREEYHIEVSKSGINHILNKIHDKYLELNKDA